MENQQPAGEAISQKKAWYKNWWGVVIVIMVLPFFAIWYVWAKTQWSNKAKWITTVLIIIFSMGMIGSTEQNNNSQPTISNPTQELKNETQALQQPEKKSIPYEVVDEWAIPNGGKGKRIVVSADYLNEADMALLGETLKEDTKDDRNAFVMVHTDKKSAQIQKKSPSEITDAELSFAGKHFVGQYMKNAEGKINTFSIYLNGVDDTSKYKEIKY